eukprot:499630_1
MTTLLDRQNNNNDNDKNIAKGNEMKIIPVETAVKIIAATAHSNQETAAQETYKIPKTIVCVLIAYAIIHVITIAWIYNSIVNTGSDSCECALNNSLDDSAVFCNSVDACILINSQSHITIPSQSPSTIPSQSPTQNPTNAASASSHVYQHHIGDFKISAQASTHDNWLLCDGTSLNTTDYPQLFSVIGYMFGGSNSLFTLPDPTDRVIGIVGNSYAHGTMTGNDTISLTEENMPSHWHYLAASDSLYDTNTIYSYSESDRPYLYSDWLYSNWARTYQLQAGADSPNGFHSSSVGNGTSFNIVQPTLFIGNLFVFADW